MRKRSMRLHPCGTRCAVSRSYKSIRSQYWTTSASEDRTRGEGEAALAVVIVDKQGCLVGSPAIAVSSFGWGIIKAPERELEDLAQWADVESRLTARIEKILRNQTTNVTERRR